MEAGTTSTGQLSRPLGSKAKQRAACRRLRERRRYTEYRVRWAQRQPSTSIGKARIRRLFELQEVWSSFLGNILGLIFGLSYGIARVVTSRAATPSAGFYGNENEMGFGQLVPLLLIALPVLAAGEVYCGRSGSPTMRSTVFDISIYQNDLKVTVRKRLRLSRMPPSLRSIGY